MPGFNILQALRIITLRMIKRGSIYPLRTAARVVQATHSNLHGPARWWAILDALQAPKAPQKEPIAGFTPVGPASGVEIGERQQVTITARGGVLQVMPLAADLLRLRLRPDGVFPDPFSYSVSKPDATWPAVETEVADGADRIVISTSRLHLSMDRQSGALTLQDNSTGQTFFKASAGHHPPSGQVAWQAEFAAGTPFYGLGEKASDLNHAGRRFELWNADPSGYGRGQDPIYMSVPFVMALANGQAVGLFFDNSYRAWVDAGADVPGRLVYQAAGGELRVYMMVGTPQAVLARYTELTGRMKLPPLWALGFHQSRWSYYPDERVLEIAHEFRERRLPCDVIHLDIHYMDGYRCFTWDRERFPQPRRMLDALHEQGFKAISIIDPGIKVDPGYSVYDEGVQRDVFVKYPDGVPFIGPVWPGDCHFPDFSHPAVRAWWGSLYEGLLADGLDAFWNDMNEPAIIAPDAFKDWVPGILHHDKDGQGGTHAELHNVYGLLMVRASAEGLVRLRPDRRLLLLSRSGWAGLQRFAVHWTADNQSTWDHLRLSISMVLNLGLSGVPFTGPDTGGFTGGPSPELFARWMQISAFTPFFRVHSMAGSPDQEPWAFGPEVEAISRKVLEWRYRLLPYLYTATWQAAQTGLPIMRPLFFTDPGDDRLHSLDDQFLCGDALLVAPVLDEGRTQREVTLPGGVWYDFWTGERHAGGQTISTDAPLDVLPLFVRGGAAIPLWPVQQYVGEKPVEVLDLAVYAAPGEHTSLLYEDDGLRPDYEWPAAHRLSRFTLAGEPGGAWHISRTTISGSFPLPYRRVRLHLTGFGPDLPTPAVSGGEIVSVARSGATAHLVEITALGDFTLRW